MLRCIIAERLSGLMLAIYLMSGCVVANAQDKQPAGTIESLQSMLEMIDPYRPGEKVLGGELHVFGSTSMDAMAHGWATGFKQFHPAVEIEISAAGSEEALEQLLVDPSGIAMLSRPVTDDELQKLQAKGLKKPAAFVVAVEALGVFVHASNSAKTISGEQLRAIFTTDDGSSPLSWSLLGVGGKTGASDIHLISRSESSGTQQFLRDFVFHQATMRQGEKSFDSNAEVVKAVSADPLSIAICGLKCGSTSAKPLQLTSGSSLVPSDDHAVLEGKYPLTRPLTVVIDVDQTTPEALAAQAFVRYALCQSGQRQAIVTGYYPADLPLLRAGLQQLGDKSLR